MVVLAFPGYGSSFNYTFNNDTWKKWFGPKEEDEKGKDKKSEDSDDEESDGTEDGTTPRVESTGRPGWLSGV